MESAYLYRGVNEKMDDADGGELRPKRQEKFEREITCDTTEITCDNTMVTMYPSEVNQIHFHQFGTGHETSGLSTSPHFEIAKKYAKGCDGCDRGYVYKIDRCSLGATGFKHEVVSDFVVGPSKPQDDEVIIFSDDGRALPAEVIVDKIPV